MSEYQSKIHKMVCAFFRNLSFVTVLVTLVFFVSNLWLSYASEEITVKVMFSAIAIIVASAMVGIIYTDRKKKKK